MHDVTAALRNYLAQNRHTQQRQIANDVQNLVAHKLVRKAQAGFIQHAVLRQHDGVVKRTALNQIRSTQGFDFFDESKSARRSNVARERTVIQSNGAMLYADERVRKVDETINLVSVRGLDADAPRSEERRVGKECRL